MRSCSHAATYASAMSAPVAQQVISSMKIIMGEDGSKEGVCVCESLFVKDRDYNGLKRDYRTFLWHLLILGERRINALLDNSR